MHIFIAIVSLGATAFVLYIIFRPSKADREHEAAVAKRLDDETIYDPETGAKLTLEQAERGHFIGNDGDDRVKTVEEIEQHYLDEERDVEYIRRFFAERKIQQVGDQEDILTVLYECKMIKQFDDFNVAYLWEIVPDVYVAITQILYSYTAGRTIERGHDFQLMLVYKNLDRYNLSEALSDTEKERTDEWTIARFDRKVNYEDFKELIGSLPSSPPHS